MLERVRELLWWLAGPVFRFSQDPILGFFFSREVRANSGFNRDKPTAVLCHLGFEIWERLCHRLSMVCKQPTFHPWLRIRLLTPNAQISLVKTATIQNKNSAVTKANGPPNKQVRKSNASRSHTIQSVGDRASSGVKRIAPAMKIPKAASPQMSHTGIANFPNLCLNSSIIELLSST